VHHYISCTDIVSDHAIFSNRIKVNFNVASRPRVPNLRMPLPLTPLTVDVTDLTMRAEYKMRVGLPIVLALCTACLVSFAAAQVCHAAATDLIF